jgi:hypothetical protein
MGRNDYQQQNQPQRNEMDHLRRQIAASTEMVQRLQPPSERSDDSNDAQTNFQNPFGVPQRGKPVLERYEHKWEHNIKVELLEFQESLNPDEFVDWLNTPERVFDYYEVSEEKNVKLVSIQLKGRASAW